MRAAHLEQTLWHPSRSTSAHRSAWAGPLGEVAGLLGLDCIELGEVAYYPFLNMLTIQLNSPPVPPLPLPMVRVHTELSLILGDLVDAVKDHCNRHPEGSADQWNCLSTFYEARGNNQLTLKVEIGANLIFGSLAGNWGRRAMGPVLAHCETILNCEA